MNILLCILLLLQASGIYCGKLVFFVFLFFFTFFPCDPRAELAWHSVISTPKGQIPSLKKNLAPRIICSAARIRELT